MSAFLASLTTDAWLLYRTGYALATLVIFVILLLIVLQIARVDFTGFADIVTAIVLIDQVVSCLILIGLMILMERGEGAFTALAVTPQPPLAYLAAKTAAVSTICASEMLLLVLIAYDGSLNIPLLFIGLFGIAVITTLLGVVAVWPFDTIFKFLLPMIGWGFFLGLPGFGVLIGWRPDWLMLHPMVPPLTLLEGAFVDLAPERLAYGLAGTGIWLVLSSFAAYRAHGAIRLRIAGA